MSFKSNSFFALLDDPGGCFNEAPIGAHILSTDASGFLSPSKSPTATPGIRRYHLPLN
jgi:hypothetical protein